MIRNYSVKWLSEEQKKLILESRQPELCEFVEKYNLSCDEIRDKINEVETKKNNYAGCETIYDDSRIEFRDFIIRDYIKNFSTNHLERKAKVVIGPPAAGKSTVVKFLRIDFPSTLIDPDIIKTGLGDFDGLKKDFSNGIGENKIYKEVGFINNEIFRRLSIIGENLIIPKIGADEKQIHNILTWLKSKGYETDLYLVNIPTYTASLRNISRYLDKIKTGNARLVDPDYIVSTENGPIQTFCKFFDKREEHLIKKFFAYSNDVKLGDAVQEIEIESIIRMKENQ